MREVLTGTIVWDETFREKQNNIVDEQFYLQLSGETNHWSALLTLPQSEMVNGDCCELNFLMPEAPVDYFIELKSFPLFYGLLYAHILNPACAEGHRPLRYNKIKKK